MCARVHSCAYVLRYASPAKPQVDILTPGDCLALDVLSNERQKRSHAPRAVHVSAGC